jgi:hypothetical protein
VCDPASFRLRLARNAQFTAPFFQRPLDGCREIQEQMKPICQRHCIRSTLWDGLGINAATIPSKHFYARMLFQPSLQAFHRTVGKDSLTVRITVSWLLRIANRSRMRLPGSPPAV